MANDTGQKVIRLSRSESEREKRETERGRKREKTDGWMTTGRERWACEEGTRRETQGKTMSTIPQKPKEVNSIKKGFNGMKRSDEHQYSDC